MKKTVTKKTQKIRRRCVYIKEGGHCGWSFTSFIVLQVSKVCAKKASKMAAKKEDSDDDTSDDDEAPPTKKSKKGIKR